MEQSLFEILKDGMGDYSLHHLVWHLLIVSVCIFVTGIFSIADTISGVYTAKKTGEKLRSHRLLDILPRALAVGVCQKLPVK